VTLERWCELERILDEALAREGLERDAFLTQVCGTDAALRSEVDALLAHEQPARSFLVMSALELTARAFVGDSDMIAVGHTIGTYTILSRLGAGGMAEVYRARDSKLGRDVAIKVLPPLVAADPERLARFDREALVLASLTHPHIGAIYGLERVEGRPVLVLELVEGDTLAEHIARGPIFIGEALTLAAQIADALDAAHDKGVVHRDLKPANIKIRADGVVKVLDFGLAKAKTASHGASDVTEPPIIATLSETIEGTLLGTAAYMSPEQARGEVVDRRTDVWALGCVLYEMLTGRPAFAGNTLADTLAAIVGREPDWTALPANSSDVRRLLKRCMEKEPRRRLHDAADVRIEIDDVLHERAIGGDVAHVDRKTRPSRRVTRHMMLIGALAAIAAGFGAWTLKPIPASHRSSIARLTISLPLGDTIESVFPAVALSRDGRVLAYTARRARSTSQLFVRRIDSLDVTLLTGTDGATAPFFSPDGIWIGFFAEGKLKKVLSTGGGLQTLCDASAGFGGSWGTDNSIYFAPFNTSGIWQVAASGGSPREVTRLDRAHGEVSHRWPQISADGKVVFFTVWTGPGWDEKHLEAQVTSRGERVVIVRGASTGRYLPTGHLVYARNEELFVVPFDLAHLRVTGPPVTLIDPVSEVANEGAHFIVSDNGTLAYVPPDSRPSDRRMVWVGGDGNVQPLNSPPGAYTDPALSPDGRSVAVSIQGPTDTIWIYDFSRSTLTTLQSEGSSQAPNWTPDGRRIIYRGTRAGSRTLFWRAADGSGDEERLTSAETLQTPSTLSPDGSMVLFGDMSPSTGWDIWMMPLGGGRVPQVVLRTRFRELAPKLSPDGRWLAYSSNESGRDEIYLRRFPHLEGKLTISTDGGSEPVWSRDGRELFYRNDDKMMAVPFSGGSTPTAGPAQLLFEGHFQISDAAVAGYDVSSERRFLMIDSKTSLRSSNRINVVLNWFDELNGVPR
jgi:serine/threonine protein kinase/Tol biopolymer transport system component